MPRLCPSVPYWWRLVHAMAGTHTHSLALHLPCTARLPEAQQVMVTPTAVLELSSAPCDCPGDVKGTLKVTSKIISRAFKTDRKHECSNV